MITRDDVLSALGLHARGGLMSHLGLAAGAFGLGIVAGAGLGLMLAPRSGRELRKEVAQKMNEVVARGRRRNGTRTDSRPTDDNEIEVEATETPADREGQRPTTWSHS